MSSHGEVLTPSLLRDWPLPKVEESKYGRGEVLVVGGARAMPGGALLGGLAALRVDAGRLSMGTGSQWPLRSRWRCPRRG